MVDDDTGTGRWSPDRPTTASKRSLVAVSHAIEAAVLEGPVVPPTVVVALFQHQAYFAREYAVYERIAATGALVVLAFADGEDHDVPAGCRFVVLDPAEPLADEWSVVAVGPEAGAFLVATDAHRIDPTEYTLEAGREFVGRWGWSRVQAANELARMRFALGGRLDTAAGETIDGLLSRVMPAGGAAAASGGTDGERWATHALHRMVQRMQDAREGTRVLRAQLVDAHAAVAARSAAHVDPQSGLTTPEFLSRWTNTGGPTALPVGVALFDIAALDGAEQRLGRRAAYHAARRVAAAVSEPLGPVDAAVRLSEREFALVVPGASSRHLAGLVDAVVEQLELSSEGYPDVALAGPAAWTVTLARPLPLDDLHLALGTPDQDARTLTGDPITVREIGGAGGAGGAVGAVGAGGAHHREEPVTDRMPRLRVPDGATTEPGGTDAAAGTEVAESRPDLPGADDLPVPGLPLSPLSPLEPVAGDRDEEGRDLDDRPEDGTDERRDDHRPLTGPRPVPGGPVPGAGAFDPFGAAVPPRSGPFRAPPPEDGERPRTNGTGLATDSDGDARPSGPVRATPSPSPRAGRRRLSGGESALSMLQDLPRRSRRDGPGPGRIGRNGAGPADTDDAPGGSEGGPPPTAS